MANLLQGKIAIVTGSDSGIGQATAEAFAKESADLVMTYLEDRDGAEETRRRVAEAGRRALVSTCAIRPRSPGCSIRPSVSSARGTSWSTMPASIPPAL